MIPLKPPLFFHFTLPLKQFNTRLNSNEFDKLEIVKKSAKNFKQKIWEKTLNEEIRESQIAHSALNGRAEKPTQRIPHLI